MVINGHLTLQMLQVVLGLFDAVRLTMAVKVEPGTMRTLAPSDNHTFQDPIKLTITPTCPF